jgi:hypothetical protein
VTRNPEPPKDEASADPPLALAPRFVGLGWLLLSGASVGLLSAPAVNLDDPSPAWLGLLIGLCAGAGSFVWAPAAWVYVLRAKREGLQPRASEWLVLAALTCVASLFALSCVIAGVS